MGRGVLLDMTAAGENAEAAGAPFNRRELEIAMARQGIAIRKGDIVLLHTGHLRNMDGGYTQDLAAVPGLGVEGAT